MSASELMALKQVALHSYRNLLRAQRKVFASDSNTLNEAWNRSRNEFEANRGIQSAENLKEKIEEANQITQFLEKNLVQGALLKSKESKPVISNNETSTLVCNMHYVEVKIEERVEMWDYTRNGRPTCGCC